MTRLIQISDLHLLANSTDCLGAVNTQQSLEAVLQKVRLQQPDLIVMSGDLSQEGSLASYCRLAASVSDFTCPIYWVPGNHDDLENAYVGLTANHLIAGGAALLDGWQIIFLDSTAPGLDDGFLGTLDFAHLQRCLTQYPDREAVIVMHHHPVQIDCYMDAIKVINADRFLELLSLFPQIRLVLFGHIHQEFSLLHNGVHFLGAPSTCVQFAPRLAKFAIDTSATPGYRWVELTPEGNFSTGIMRI